MGKVGSDLNRSDRTSPPLLKGGVGRRRWEQGKFFSPIFITWPIQKRGEGAKKKKGQTFVGWKKKKIILALCQPYKLSKERERGWSVGWSCVTGRGTKMRCRGCCVKMGGREEGGERGGGGGRRGERTGFVACQFWAKFSTLSLSPPPQFFWGEGRGEGGERGEGALQQWRVVITPFPLFSLLHSSFS